MKGVTLFGFAMLALTVCEPAVGNPIFDPQGRLLTLPVLKVGDREYRDIVLRLDRDGRWAISSGPAEWAGRASGGAISDRCGPEHITKQRFAAVTFGMSFDDAIAAVGCEGELVAEGMDGEDHLKAYHFEHGSSNFDLTFKNGKVASKRQTIYEGR